MPNHTNLRNNPSWPHITLQAENSVRLADDEIIVNSGNTTRNRDWLSGLPFRLVPAGMRLEAYTKNPVVLWQHVMGLPVAKGQLYTADGQLRGRILDFHRKKMPVANLFEGGVGEFDTGVIADLWNERFLNAVSVHIILSPDDENNIFETESELVIPTSEVIEFSICTIPADRDSIRQRMLSFGVAEPVVDYFSTWGVDRNGLAVPQAPIVVEDDMRITMRSVGETEILDVSENLESDVQEEEDVVADTDEQDELDAELSVTLEVTEEDERVIQLDLPDLRPYILELARDPEFVQAVAQAIQDQGVFTAAASAIAPIRVELKLPSNGARRPVENGEIVHAPVKGSRTAYAQVTHMPELVANVVQPKQKIRPSAIVRPQQ